MAASRLCILPHRTCRRRKKLLVVAGAGSAIDFGMPSVQDVHGFLLDAAQRFFALANAPTCNLYGFMHDELSKYWSASVPSFLQKTPNFEDVLYAIYALASTFPEGSFKGPLAAFVAINTFPEVIHINQRKPVDENVLRHLAQHLVDDLMTEFRRRCREPDASLRPKIAQFRDFFAHLADEFETAIITTNYEDLIYRSCPGIETGFDSSDGRFKQGRILARSSWPCLLHLHGSVHFDMDLVDGNLHGISWQEDLQAPFHQNSFGRSSVRTSEGNEFPTSCIIAGYGKPEQLQRSPFRTYYAELDRLVYTSEAVLFLGFSLIDAHVRLAFEEFRDGRDRPVVLIDYAPNGTMLAGSNFHNSDTGPARAMRVFGIEKGKMQWLGYTHPGAVDDLKAAKEFERCTVPGHRLSVWYNGMLEACNNTEKIICELGKSLR